VFLLLFHSSPLSNTPEVWFCCFPSFFPHFSRVFSSTAKRFPSLCTPFFPLSFPAESFTLFFDEAWALLPCWLRSCRNLSFSFFSGKFLSGVCCRQTADRRLVLRWVFSSENFFFVNSYEPTRLLQRSRYSFFSRSFDRFLFSPVLLEDSTLV